MALGIEQKMAANFRGVLVITSKEKLPFRAQTAALNYRALV